MPLHTFFEFASGALPIGVQAFPLWDLVSYFIPCSSITTAHPHVSWWNLVPCSTFIIFTSWQHNMLTLIDSSWEEEYPMQEGDGCRREASAPWLSLKEHLEKEIENETRRDSSDKDRIQNYFIFPLQTTLPFQRRSSRAESCHVCLGVYSTYHGPRK